MHKFESRAAGLTRTLIALAILFAFWAALGYSLWPEFMPILFRTAQSVRSVGAQPVESRYFDVRNSSDASLAQIGFIVRNLEADYEAIQKFLNPESPTPAPGSQRIPVLITNGNGPALADGVQLNIFYDNGVFNLDTAPLFLALLADGGQFSLDRNLFGQVGFALYVAEEIGRVQDLLGQSTDAWSELLRQQDALVPLTQAWEMELPQGEKQLFDLLRAGVEAGSFMRWVAKTYGLQAARDLRRGLTITDVTGLSLAEAETAWLADLAARNLNPQPCRLAIGGNPFLRQLCRHLDGG